MAKIVIVDDALFMRTMLKDILLKAGHEVVGEGSNGEEGVQQYRKHNPEVILLDITMPVMDGLQAVKVIRALDSSANVIMCSAMGQQAMVIDAIQSGAKDFIIKPFQPARVLEAIDKALV